MEDEFTKPNAGEEQEPLASRPSRGRGIVRFLRELLETILPALPHAVELLQGAKGADRHPDEG